MDKARPLPDHLSTELGALGDFGPDSPESRKRQRDPEPIDSDFKKYAPITYKTAPPDPRDPIKMAPTFVKDLLNVHKRRRIFKGTQEPVKITPIGYLYKGVVTPEMCEQVRECYHYVVDNKIDSPGRVKFGSKSAQYGKVGGHKCCYLKNDGKNAFHERCPEVENRIMELAYDFDCEYKVLTDEAEPQSVEYIQYKEGDWIGWHSDLNGSVITLVTMLSKESRYEGGDLQLKYRKDGQTVVFGEHLDTGDTIVFLSQDQDHRVTPVTWGRRRVLVIEVKQHRLDEDHHSSDESTSSSDSESLLLRKQRRREEKLRLMQAANPPARQIPQIGTGAPPPTIQVTPTGEHGQIARDPPGRPYKGAL